MEDSTSSFLLILSFFNSLKTSCSSIKPKIIKENIRQSDYAFRWGGEEFIVAMPETSIEGAEKLAEKLRIAVKEHKFYKVNFVTISVGVAEFFKNETIDELIKRADEALYASKEGGRNLVTVSSKN